MTDAILSASIEFIGQLLADEAKFLKGVSKEVELLHQNLNCILRFLRYADTKQDVRESIKDWVSEFSGIAFEATNLVEDYAFRFGPTQRNLAGGCTYKLQRYACIFRQCHTLHDLGIEIQSLNTRISNLTQKFQEFGVWETMEGQGSSSSVQQQLKKTYSFKADEDFTVGPPENDVDRLVDHLQNEGVVSIFGMGGIGKTTLARKLYHDPRLKQCFQAFAWCCISQKWDMEDILRRILVKLSPELESEIKGKDWLVENLRKVMQDKRCLIVLDDMWSNETWDCIKDAFFISKQGSKILLTTRNSVVAVHVDADGYHHQPKLLTEEESWKLLKIKCLKETSGEDLHKFEDIGKEMLKRCGGVPLAVIVLCGVLKTKKSFREWHVVHENIKSYLARGEKIGKEEGVAKVLEFSYYDLPYQLKPCFLYLGKMKEDCSIEAERLYQLWMAEGMVLASDRMEQETMMAVAERYLDELAKRCMVQVELYEEWQPAITRFKSCRLHDLMRDLCLDKAKEENLYKVIDLGHENIDVPSTDFSPATKRYYGLVLRSFQNDLEKYIFPQKEQTKHLQSFWCEYDGGWGIMCQINNFKMLKLLIIEGLMELRPYSKSRLKCIGHLIHLRCLSLRNSMIWELPSSLGNLNHLETLDLGDTECSRIPDVLWKLGHLRHLYLPISRCKYSSRKLRLDRLCQLEILEGVDNINCNLKDLSELINLKALVVSVSNNLVDVEQIVQYISSLNYILSASLRIRDCDFEIDSNSPNNKGLAVLEHVLFCKNLRSLWIYGIFCKQLPNYQPHLFSSSGLTELLLDGSNIEEDPMPTLEKFPNLRIFYFRNSFKGKEMICHARGFLELKILCLSDLSNLEKWKVEEGAMPKLSRLDIYRCTNLKMIPDGLRSITTLNELVLQSMPEEFINRVQIVNGIEGPDSYKIRHVTSVFVET